ncbi:MAG TPA: aminodeoxychorismate/anthranilate synthase component II [Gaiellaceae bacterium]|nr:aminodeoxychorismate/anthranilate synthase component II [Gaiellaceae bacterium]
MLVLVVDNYDSFTYNLVHLLEELGADVVVRRSDDASPAEAAALAPDRLVVSPGPGRPEGAGHSLELIQALGPSVPTLGVCLGHQAIVQAYGGEIGRARALVHGKASRVRHDGEGVFTGLPPEIDAGRYHSLATARVPDVLAVTARTDDGEVMGVRHSSHPVEGVQFHPESILTPEGPQMIANFLFRSPGSASADPDLLRSAGSGSADSARENP